MSDWDNVFNDLDELINSDMSPDSGFDSPERAVNISSEYEIINSCGNKPEPHLEVIEQPQNYFGFRYLTEYKKDKPYGPLTGISSTKTNKTSPTVRLNNYGRKAIIRCWVCDSNKNAHLHQLLTKDNEEIKYEPHDKVVCAENNTAVFEGLNIIHAKTKDEISLQRFNQKRCHIASGFHLRNNLEINEEDLLKEVEKLEKNKVLLFFEAFDYETKEKLAETYSYEIKNSRNARTKPPKIARQSVSSGRVEGDTEVLIFVDKVPSDIKEIDILFFERNQSNEICWQSKAKIEEIWHQYGIAFRTPPYRNSLIKEKKQVFFKIVRVSDESSSNDMLYYYEPDPRMQDDYLEPSNNLGKRRRMNVDNEFRFDIQLSNMDTTPCELNSQMEQIQNIGLLNANIKDENFISQAQVLVKPEGTHLDTRPDAYNIPADDVFTNVLYPDFPPESHNLSVSDVITEIEAILGVTSVGTSIEPPEYIVCDSTCNSDSEQLLTDSARNITTDGNETINPDGLRLVKKLFHLIVEDNNESFVDETIQEIKSSNIKLCDFSTAYEKNPLHIAIENKKFTYLKSLLSAGVNVNALDGDRNSPLHLAVYHNADPSIISFLLSKGADIGMFNSDGETPVHLACRLGRDIHLKFLITYVKTGAIYRSRKTGDSPLHVAVRYNFFDLVETLLKEGAVFSLNNAGFSPLDYAVQNKNEKLISLLLNSLDPKEKRSVLLVAVALMKVQQNDRMKELLTDYIAKGKQVLAMNEDLSDESILCSALNKKCVLDAPTN